MGILLTYGKQDLAQNVLKFLFIKEDLELVFRTLLLGEDKMHTFCIHVHLLHRLQEGGMVKLVGVMF